MSLWSHVAVVLAHQHGVCWVSGAEVTEGQSVVIDQSRLDASNLMSKLPPPQRSSHEVWFQVTSLPQHGVLVVGERNVTRDKPNFSQFIINKYGITYKHDDSETTRDFFAFSAWVNPKGQRAQRPLDSSDTVEERFNVTVTPVNDQPPVLKTKAPSLAVVQGDTVALKPENLRVDDLDNPPEDIRFSVISRPSNGHLALEGSLGESVVTFTQAQVNNGSVFFVHDGGRSSGVFYFSVSDGRHKPVYKLFNLDVTPISVSLLNHSGLTLEQGAASARLTPDHLAATTNGRNATIHYNVTRPPTFGTLVVDGRQVAAFEQGDVDGGRLSYHVVSPSAEDSFRFTVFTSEACLSEQVLNITVSPRLRVAAGVTAPNGVPLKLGSAVLDASDLASVCECDPVFEMVSHPKHGKVVRTESGTPPGSEYEPAGSFTFQDVVGGTVTLELRANMSGVQELNDSLVFVLKAAGVPPARGELHFTIVPYDPAAFTTAQAPVQTASPVPQTPQPASRNGTAPPVLSTAVVSPQQPGKSQQRFKGRNRWGSANRTRTVTTTLGRPTAGTDRVPFQNTPVRVESFPQRGSNPLLVILPLLALLLLVIIFVVLVVFLRHHRQRKQNAAAHIEPPFPAGESFQGHAQRSTTVPTVTVTPLSPTCPGSPSLNGLLAANQGSAYNTVDSNTFVSSWSNESSAASSQMIRTATPTLQKNQYWV